MHKSDLFEEETPTRELSAVESPVEWSGEKGKSSGYYKIKEILNSTAVDMWEIMDGEPESEYPATLLEKHISPFRRNQ